MTDCTTLGFAVRLSYSDGFSAVYRIFEIVNPENRIILKRMAEQHGVCTWKELSQTNQKNEKDLDKPKLLYKTAYA